MLVAGHDFSDPLFETPALLITLITLGRLISAYARRRATSALDSLRSLQTDTVSLVNPTNGVTSILSELSQNPVDQERIREEIHAFRGKKGDGFTLSDYESMPYLNACVKVSGSRRYSHITLKFSPPYRKDSGSIPERNLSHEWLIWMTLFL